MDFETGVQARAKLKLGVDKLADAVRVTLGPTGRNVIFRTGDKPIITNDGVTIANHIVLKDVVESFGADIVKQAALETNAVAGDGTTTAIVLAQSLLAECLKHLDEHEDVDPMELRAMLIAALHEAEMALTLKATKLTKNQIADVATISIGGDRELGTLVAEVVAKVGNGAITIEGQQKIGIDTEITVGLNQFGGVASYQMLDKAGKVTVSSRPILVVDSKLTTGTSIVPLLQQLAQAGEKNLVIAAVEGFSDEVLNLLIANNQRETINTLAIKIEDPLAVAEATGAQVVSKLGQNNLRNLNLGVLGKAKKVLATQYESLIIGSKGAGNRKVAVIRVGVPTEIEFQEKQMRIDDAIHAVRAAQESGVLPGGGTALLAASDAIGSKDLGSYLLAAAMKSPAAQIRENGFSGKLQPEVVDPLKVVITALRSAVSAVSTLITTETVIYQKEEWYD